MAQLTNKHAHHTLEPITPHTHTLEPMKQFNIKQMLLIHYVTYGQANGQATCQTKLPLASCMLTVGYLQTIGRTKSEDRIGG